MASFRSFNFASSAVSKSKLSLQKTVLWCN